MDLDALLTEIERDKADRKRRETELLAEIDAALDRRDSVSFDLLAADLAKLRKEMAI